MHFENKVIYIASPYSHENEEVVAMRIKALQQIVVNMTMTGIVCICPVLHYHQLREQLPQDPLFWIKVCRKWLSRCDELCVAQFEDWEQSGGVRDEFQYAKQKGIHISYINPDKHIDIRRYIKLTGYENPMRAGIYE